MAMAFLTMPTKWATMVIITGNLWRNRDEDGNGIFDDADEMGNNGDNNGEPME